MQTAKEHKTENGKVQIKKWCNLPWVIKAKIPKTKGSKTRPICTCIYRMVLQSMVSFASSALYLSQFLKRSEFYKVEVQNIANL
jgi:hypothetical protein